MLILVRSLVVVGLGRPVTRARRNFGAAELEELGRDDIRRLCHGLLLAQGLSASSFRAHADYDEYLVLADRLWLTRRTVVRIYDRVVEVADIDQVREGLDDAVAADALVIAPKGLASEALARSNVAVLGPVELAREVERSPLADWSAGRPSLAASRLETMLALPEAARLVDPAGIAWLPSLAFNELPFELQALDIAPEDMLEEKAFRLLTSILRFGGERYGQRHRGERLPDALLNWRAEPSCWALLDCKAAASGYQMTSDHLLRFEEYHDRLSDSVAEQGGELTHLVVLSSHFPGRPGDAHPFNDRHAEILERTGMRLAYIRASDLAWFAHHIEVHHVRLADREAVSWSSVFDEGLVEFQHLEQALTPVA